MAQKEITIVPKSKLQHVIKDITKLPFDREVITKLQQFSKKFVSDVVTRSAFISEHKNTNVITSNEIFYIVEKEFDYCFGDREILKSEKTPAAEHTEKMAELSRIK